MEAMLQTRYCRPPTPCRTTDTHNLIHHGATDAALRPLPFCSNRSHRRFTSPIKMHRTPQETERNAYRPAESNLGFYLGLLRHATSPRDVLIAWRTRCFYNFLIFQEIRVYFEISADPCISVTSAILLGFSGFRGFEGRCISAWAFASFGDFWVNF